MFPLPCYTRGKRGVCDIAASCTAGRAAAAPHRLSPPGVQLRLTEATGPLIGASQKHPQSAAQVKK